MKAFGVPEIMVVDVFKLRQLKYVGKNPQTVKRDESYHMQCMRLEQFCGYAKKGIVDPVDYRAIYQYYISNQRCPTNLPSPHPKGTRKDIPWHLPHTRATT